MLHFQIMLGRWIDRFGAEEMCAARQRIMRARRSHPCQSPSPQPFDARAMEVS